MINNKDDNKDDNKIISQRLSLIRTEMIKRKIDFYLVPTKDPHNSEYVPECFMRRAWISGFDGSAAEVLIGLNHAYLWTDGRYFLQAQQQLDFNNFTLMKQISIEEWLIANAKNCNLAIDAHLISIAKTKSLQAIVQKINTDLILENDNLIDWCKNELGENFDLPQTPAFALAKIYSGESVGSKLTKLRKALNENQADCIALNALDEIAWLFNLRGADIAYSPLVISYALVKKNKCYLFIEPNKLTARLIKSLNSTGITLLSYEKFALYLNDCVGTVWLDDTSASYWMYQQLNDDNTVFLYNSPIALSKACKNPVEIKGAHQAHHKDAIALIKFLTWLNLDWQRQTITEISATAQLSKYRLKEKNCKGESFATISAFGSNGAIIHYHANHKTNKAIDDSDLYLIDSGGQYLEGTTDVTRTIHLGEPSRLQKKHYTLVLKGHLALARSIFPQGTCGEHLDTLARLPLWCEYLNYCHGTGHGVGSFLGVHEGPQRISPMASKVPLALGMIVSNEPGLYLDGQYGIRIENLCTVVEEVADSVYGPFYKLLDLTLVPYCKKLIAMQYLDLKEINQLKNYYNRIKLQILPQLDRISADWLINEMKIFSRY